MGPDSPWLIVLLVLGAIGMLVLAIWLRPWPARAVAGALTIVLAMVSGFAVVNDYYGYYRSWTVLAGDLGGAAPAGFGMPAVHRTDRAQESGQLVRMLLRGPVTGISRPALVYLPPQYNEPGYGRTRFPVVELLHGSPGEPADWVGPLRIVAVANTLIRRRIMGPLVLVMPSINPGGSYLDCVNTPSVPDQTYLVDDVRSVVLAHLRVSRQPAEWGVAGYSSGGYCAANLALRDRASFGAAGVMDGYFRASDGPAGQALGNDPLAETANSPLQIARTLSVEARPLPAFWVSAGTGDRGDYVAAKAFINALKGLEQVHFAVQPAARHNFYAWADAVPTMLSWMWQQLAPPALRVQFPVAGSPSSVRLPPAVHGPVPRHARPAQGMPSVPAPQRRPLVRDKP
jgi:enterochelin esterase-like enzyme